MEGGEEVEGVGVEGCGGVGVLGVGFGREGVFGEGEGVGGGRGAVVDAVVFFDGGFGGVGVMVFGGWSLWWGRICFLVGFRLGGVGGLVFLLVEGWSCVVVIFCFVLEALERLKECFSSFFVEDFTHIDKFSGVFPFFVAGEDVQCVEF